jgi:ATP-dependent 26S proteasome regulatory subunit
VLIDDFESICTRKEMLNQENEKRILTLFTSLLDQSQNVLYLCLTNKIDNIDLSLRRPGRLDKEIEIPIPVQSARYSVSLICQQKKI